MWCGTIGSHLGGRKQADCFPIRLPSTERDAARRIRHALENIGNLESLKGWTPDLMIKMIPDIDLVFFGGRLLGNVIVKWADTESFAMQCHSPDVLGITWPSQAGDGRDGQTQVHLNASGLLLDGGRVPGFRGSWLILLHELVVS